MLHEIRNFFHFSGIAEECVFVQYIKGDMPHASFASLEKPVTVDTEGITNSILNARKAFNHTDLSDQDYLKSVLSCLINANFGGASECLDTFQEFKCV